MVIPCGLHDKEPYGIAFLDFERGWITVIKRSYLPRYKNTMQSST